MIEDPDVIFVDFDELFDDKALDNAFGQPLSGYGQSHSQSKFEKVYKY
jgi:hypothetical protein